jgi:hypothetical protein
MTKEEPEALGKQRLGLGIYGVVLINALRPMSVVGKNRHRVDAPVCRFLTPSGHDCLMRPALLLTEKSRV